MIKILYLLEYSNRFGQNYTKFRPVKKHTILTQTVYLWIYSTVQCSCSFIFWLFSNYVTPERLFVIASAQVLDCIRTRSIIGMF